MELSESFIGKIQEWPLHFERVFVVSWPFLWNCSDQKLSLASLRKKREKSPKQRGFSIVSEERR